VEAAEASTSGAVEGSEEAADDTGVGAADAAAAAAAEASAGFVEVEAQRALKTGFSRKIARWTCNPDEMRPTEKE